MNTYVLCHWARDTRKTEAQVFEDFMTASGITGPGRQHFRELCLLSADAVVRGHASVVLPFENGWVWWLRDHFLSGLSPKPDADLYASEGRLLAAFRKLQQQGLLQTAVAEKFESVAIWAKIVRLSKQVTLKNKADQQYIRTSSLYGYRLHEIIAQGWQIMALGYEGDLRGTYDKARLKATIALYDVAWLKYNQLKKQYPDCATLYKPYGFVFTPPDYHTQTGLGLTVDKYRTIANQ